MSVLDPATATRVGDYMQQWGMDPRDPEAFALARQWMEYVDNNRYYTEAVFMPYSVNRVRGILVILFMGAFIFCLCVFRRK